MKECEGVARGGYHRGAEFSRVTAAGKKLFLSLLVREEGKIMDMLHVCVCVCVCVCERECVRVCVCVCERVSADRGHGVGFPYCGQKEKSMGQCTGLLSLEKVSVAFQVACSTTPAKFTVNN